MKPRIFIGSSTENLDIAYAVQENLDHDADCTVWTQDVFQLSKSAMESLVVALDDFEAGIFVFTPSDVTTLRGADFQTVRDNVILELGMFIGRRGRERTFIIVPRGVADLHLPTDLLGVTAATYEGARRDKNWRAALGPACNQIRKSLAQEVAGHQTVSKSVVPQLTDAEIVATIQSWMGSREARLNTRTIKFADVDRELNLPEGSARKHIKAAAAKWRYVVEQEGPSLILFKELPDDRPPSRRTDWKSMRGF